MLFFYAMKVDRDQGQLWSPFDFNLHRAAWVTSFVFHIRKKPTQVDSYITIPLTLIEPHYGHLV